MKMEMEFIDKNTKYKLVVQYKVTQLRIIYNDYKVFPCLLSGNIYISII